MSQRVFPIPRFHSCHALPPIQIKNINTKNKPKPTDYQQDMGGVIFLPKYLHISQRITTFAENFQQQSL